MSAQDVLREGLLPEGAETQGSVSAASKARAAIGGRAHKARTHKGSPHTASRDHAVGRSGRLVPIQSIRRAVLTLRPAMAVSAIGMPKAQ